MKPMEAPATKLPSPTMATSTPTDDTLGLPGIGITITYERLASSTLYDSVSRKRQEDALDNICADHSLPPIARRFYDEGIPGMMANKPGYAAMQAFGDAWPGCTIIVQYGERLVRSHQTFFDFVDFLVRNDIRLFDEYGEIIPAELRARCVGTAISGDFQ